MVKTLKIALAQLNPTVGDIAGNIAKAKRAHAEAARMGADLVALPELFVTGYPPEDLVLKPAFTAAARDAVEALAVEIGAGPKLLLGTVWPEGGHVYNAVALLGEGAVQAVRYKGDLPNYGVFGEKRVFAAGARAGPPPPSAGGRAGAPFG